MKTIEIIALILNIYAFSVSIIMAKVTTKASYNPFVQNNPHVFVETSGNPVTHWIRTILLGLFVLLILWSYITWWAIILIFATLWYVGPVVGGSSMLILKSHPQNLKKMATIWFWIALGTFLLTPSFF